MCEKRVGGQAKKKEEEESRIKPATFAARGNHRNMSEY
jgi:hypothetical protein